MSAKSSKPFCRTCGFYHDGPCQRWPAQEGQRYPGERNPLFLPDETPEQARRPYGLGDGA